MSDESSNPKGPCTCDYCTSKALYTEQLFGRMMALMAKVIQEDGTVPGPDQVKAYLAHELKGILDSVFAQVGMEILMLGLALPEPLPTDQATEEPQAIAAEGKEPYDKSKN